MKSKLLIALPAVAMLAATMPTNADARTKDIVKYGAIGLGALALSNMANNYYSQPSYYGGYYSQPYYGGYYSSYPSYGYSYPSYGYGYSYPSYSYGYSGYYGY